MGVALAIARRALFAWHRALPQALADQETPMTIRTIFAHVSCSDLRTSIAWYGKLFGRAPDRRPMEGLAEWHFTDSAEVQLYEEKKHAGHSTLTLGVLPLEPERKRLAEAGL